LEQDEYFLLNPTAKVTGIDLAPGMLNRLRKKHSDKDLNLILGLFLMFHLELRNSMYCIGRGLVSFCG
jgi:ubiquinone/menaquinone biosynthesis C-methylase UbiE